MGSAQPVRIKAFYIFNLKQVTFKTKKRKGKIKMKLTKKKIAVIGCAALVAAALATTFAWPTSSDQVTNHLETDGRLDTSIVEVFDPPTEWTPGQSIQKEVAIANLGDTDAFIRVKLTETIETNVESAVDTAGTENPLIYTDEQIAKYPTVIDNGDTDIPDTVTVCKNDNNGYIAYVTATKQKVNLEGIAFTMKSGSPVATVTGNFGITYATTVKATTDGKTFGTMTKIDDLTAGQSYGGITLTSADVTALNRYVNDAKDNLYLSQLGNGAPIVLILDDNWSDNWDYNDGYFYYKRICKVDATTENLLSKVIMLPQATNDWANAKYDIVVDHEGILASVDCIADMWGADVSEANTAAIGTASVDTTGAISVEA